MKTKITLVLVAAMTLVFTGCNSYKKTKSGLVYKLISGGSKDSLIKAGNTVKFNYVRKLNDSVLFSSYGKMPSYIPLQSDPGSIYSPIEVLFFARKGDSIITVELVDTLLKKLGPNQLPPDVKKGDRFTTYIKILEVFRNDSLYQKDQEAEMAKDKPRQEKEMKEMQAKELAQMEVQKKKDMEEYKKSGEYDKAVAALQNYITGKKINAQKTAEGSYVLVKDKGNGEPVLDDKFIRVKYTGKLLETDSVFQANEYTFQLGKGEVIRGWDDGLKSFNNGGKGTLYIPGYMAYGKNPGPGHNIWEALVFDVEILNVAATFEAAAPPPPPPAPVKK